MESWPCDEQNALRANQLVLRHFGWYICEDGKGRAWFYSPGTKQWSQQFPLLAILGEEEVNRLLTKPAAKARPGPPPSMSPSEKKRRRTRPSRNPSKKKRRTRLPSPPPGPSTHRSHKVPPSPLGSSPRHQYSGARPPPLAIIPTENCSWHETCDWAGQLYPTVPNGVIKDDVTIKTDDKLQSALT